MLLQLNIENFAINEQLDVGFDSGLVILTGETGAGKSIIIDAVETILGGRAESTQVRAGAERAVVEAHFRIQQSLQPQLAVILEQEELLEDPELLSLGREIRMNGRNIARVNGRVVNVSILRAIGEFLVDVHGQSEHLSLLKVDQHLGLLDRFALADAHKTQIDHQAIYHDSYQRFQVAGRELQRIRLAEQDSARRLDMLQFQIKEIHSVHLAAGEEEDLRSERNRLSNSEVISSLLQPALVAMDEGGAAGVGAAGVMTANPMAIPLLAASSPRLAGEATYYSGKGAGAAERGAETVNRLAELLNVNPRIAANLLYQAQQPKR